MKTLEQRAEEFRARLRVRAWEFRQLRGSKGTWYRVRRMLAKAGAAYVVDDAAFSALIREGMTREPVGDELEPTKNFVFVTAGRAELLDGARSIPVRLSAQLLAASNVVLVAFDDPL